MEIRIIDPDSGDYRRMVELRIKVLLEPIGIPATYIDTEKEKNDMMIGAFDKDALIGCCVLTSLPDGVVQLRQMAVMNNLQGKGVGAAIVGFAECTARSKGFTRLMMHARDPVIGFYEKCGYEIAGEQFFEVGMGHHRLEKKL